MLTFALRVHTKHGDVTQLTQLNDTHELNKSFLEQLGQVNTILTSVEDITQLYTKLTNDTLHRGPVNNALAVDCDVLIAVDLKEDGRATFNRFYLF